MSIPESRPPHIKPHPNVWDLQPQQLFIAEVKTRSPDGFTATETWEELFELAQAHGDIVSVHTSPDYGGSWALLEYACKKSRRPVLAKGFHSTHSEVNEAFRRGANFVLQVAESVRQDNPREWSNYYCTHKWDNRVVVEASNLFVLNKLLQQKVQSLAWNTRIPTTGADNPVAFADVLQVLPPNFPILQASNIKTPLDIHPQAGGYIVGTHLKKFIDYKKARPAWYGKID